MVSTESLFLNSSQINCELYGIFLRRRPLNLVSSCVSSLDATKYQEICIQIFQMPQEGGLTCTVLQMSQEDGLNYIILQIPQEGVLTCNVFHMPQEGGLTCTVLQMSQEGGLTCIILQMPQEGGLTCIIYRVHFSVKSSTFLDQNNRGLSSTSCRKIKNLSRAKKSIEYRLSLIHI